MKPLLSTYVTIAALALCSAGAEAQNPIPNPGFENWNGTLLTGWSHNSSAPPLDTVIKSTDAYSGTYAVRGEVKEFVGFGYPPSLFAGTAFEPYFTISENHQNFSMRYKFHSENEDELLVNIVLTNLDVGGGAEGSVFIAADASTFTEIEIPLIYDDDNPPGWQATIAAINFVIVPPQGMLPSPGTYYVLDHATFDGLPVGIEDDGLPGSASLAQARLAQNFPNPFNPSTTIVVDIPDGPNPGTRSRVTIHDLAGRNVRVLMDDIAAQPGRHVLHWDGRDDQGRGVGSGVYIYQIEHGTTKSARRMVLVK